MAEETSAKGPSRTIDSRSWTGELEDLPEPLPPGYQWPTEFKHNKAPAMSAKERLGMFATAAFLCFGIFSMQMIFTWLLASHSPLHPSPETGHTAVLHLTGQGSRKILYVKPAEVLARNGLMILSIVLPAVYLFGYWTWVKLRRR